MTASPPTRSPSLIWPLLVFAVVNLGLVAATGARTGGDTGLYLDGARRLLEGQPLVAREPSYLGYIAVAAVCQWLGAGVQGLVVVQVLMAIAAAAGVFWMAVELGGPSAGLLAVGLLTLDIETNRWHAYVLADSLYLSALASTAWLVHRASQPPRVLWRYVAAFLALGATSLIRPEGWFVVPAAAVYWVFRGVRAPRARRAAVGSVLVACGLLVVIVAPRLQGNLEAVGPADMLRRGQTMWDSDVWRLSMPDDGEQESRWGAIGSAVGYAARHPAMTAALVGARLVVHAVHVRPFYSRLHNVAIVAWLAPVYACAVYGWWTRRTSPLLRWSVAVIATQAFVVAVTHADYDGRYLSHVLPILYPITAAGAVTIAGRLGRPAAGSAAARA